MTSVSFCSLRLQTPPLLPADLCETHKRSYSFIPTSRAAETRASFPMFPSNRHGVQAPVCPSGGIRASWWCGPILASAPNPWGFHQPLLQLPPCKGPPAMQASMECLPVSEGAPWQHPTGVLLQTPNSAGIRDLIFHLYHSPAAPRGPEPLRWWHLGGSTLRSLKHFPCLSLGETFQVWA